MRRSRLMLAATAAALAGAMSGAAEVVSAGTQSARSIVLGGSGAQVPRRVMRSGRNPFAPRRGKGPLTKRRKHSRKKPPRAWRRSRVLKLRARK